MFYLTVVTIYLEYVYYIIRLNVFGMAHFRSYWSHLDISPTICPHQMADVGFQPMTLGFLKHGPTHCAIGAAHVG